MIEQIAQQYGIDLENMDSLAMMNLIMAIEYKLGVNFNMNQIIGMKDICDIQKVIDEYGYQENE